MYHLRLSPTISWPYGQTVDELTYYSAGGAKLVVYDLSVSGSNLRAAKSGEYYEYFGGKMLKNSGGWVNADRQGSIGAFFPYGQERPSATSDGKEKFATYFRDSETGLDYAVNRYHDPGDGRFMTADPKAGSARARDPGSWNRYAYTRGDPVNRVDPNGLDDGLPAVHREYFEVTESVNTVGDEGIGPYLYRPIFGWIWDIPPGVLEGLCESGIVEFCPQSEPEPGPSFEGKGGAFKVDKKSIKKDGDQFELVISMLKELRTRLKADEGCSKWLGDRVDSNIGFMLGEADGNVYVAVANITSGQNAVQAPDASKEWPADKLAAFVVSTAGAFFLVNQKTVTGQVSLLDTGFGPGTTRAQIFILLHELAHFQHEDKNGAEEFVQDAAADGSSNMDLVYKNNQLLIDKCGSLLF